MQVELLPAYLNLDKIGKIIKRQNDDIQYFGNITKNQCPLIKRLIQSIFDLLSGDIDQIPEPELNSLPVSDFVYSKSVDGFGDFSSLFLEAQAITKGIMLEYGYRPEEMVFPDKVRIKWVVTTEGASLYSKDKSYQIDYDFYREKWLEIRNLV